MRADGFDYRFDPSACATCEGGCCTGESGYIYATQAEFEAIAAFLKITLDQLKKEYLTKAGYKYSIKELSYNGSHDCIFYDRAIHGCSIYEVRPTQCRTFPFWDYFKKHPQELKDECPGVIFDKVENA